MDSRWDEKQQRRQDKDARMIELRDMLQNVVDEMENNKQKAEADRQESRQDLERVIEDLRQQNREQQDLLTSLSQTWRDDCERYHEETVNAVKSTANEQVPFNVQGYLDEFSRALATEVRMLLGEVGKIREERRALQHEIGELLCLKSKYTPGGEFEPDWRPPAPAAPPVDPMPPVPEMPEAPPMPKPGWRTVHTRPKKKKKAEQQAQQQQPVASTSAPPVHLMQQHLPQDLRGQLTRSWATWQPDRAALTPPSVEPTLAVPGRESPGLFGPRTPSNGSMYDRR
ncbi:hypothetical protein CPB84DRAFT_1868348 [Gymnopilus junonius]|uniref:Uncharacterized protein n=1 Tax=Gymnopilus junonius TaxID=109634 RepID=A0A9P5NF85_GYMJU|nr:hypothetical protein CPB84DRAFT_1868348 [Gymnopilus junonius]